MSLVEPVQEPITTQRHPDEWLSKFRQGKKLQTEDVMDKSVLEILTPVPCFADKLSAYSAY